MTNPNTPTKAGEAPCGECGMVCHATEYHPFAACLMFKACHDGAVVRANLVAPSTADRAASVGAVSLTDQQCAAQLGLMKTPPMKDGAALHDWAMDVMRAGYALATPQASPIPQAERSDTERLNRWRQWLLGCDWPPGWSTYSMCLAIADEISATAPATSEAKQS